MAADGGNIFDLAYKIVPATLSPESYQDMTDRIEIFPRGLKRRSDAEEAQLRTNRDDVPD
jgi:hypothetical protein